MIRQASSGGRRGHRVRHIRLGSLLRLRVRLLGRCLEVLNCCPRRWSPTRARKMLGDAGRTAPVAERESSFHAQAIADCLEFIKRSSHLPGDHKTDS